jgi:hypothetical protein
MKHIDHLFEVEDEPIAYNIDKNEVKYIMEEIKKNKTRKLKLKNYNVYEIGILGILNVQRCKTPIFISSIFI